MDGISFDKIYVRTSVWVNRSYVAYIDQMCLPAVTVVGLLSEKQQLRPGSFAVGYHRSIMTRFHFFPSVLLVQGV